MASEANKKLKLCKRQARRVYEILRLHYVQKAGGLTDKNQAYKDYRVAVKKRLNKPFQVSWNLFMSFCTIFSYIILGWYHDNLLMKIK